MISIEFKSGLYTLRSLLRCIIKSQTDQIMYSVLRKENTFSFLDFCSRFFLGVRLKSCCCCCCHCRHRCHYHRFVVTVYHYKKGSNTQKLRLSTSIHPSIHHKQYKIKLVLFHIASFQFIFS